MEVNSPTEEVANIFTKVDNSTLHSPTFSALVYTLPVSLNSSVKIESLSLFLALPLPFLPLFGGRNLVCSHQMTPYSKDSALHTQYGYLHPTAITTNICNVVRTNIHTQM
jgi:hypothetical protein